MFFSFVVADKSFVICLLKRLNCFIFINIDDLIIFYCVFFTLYFISILNRNFDSFLFTNSMKQRTDDSLWMHVVDWQVVLDGI